MLKEEKAVRDWKNAVGVDSRHFMREVTALVRAVREDCVKVAYEEALRHHSGNAKWDMNVGENIAAAIRGRK